MVSAAQSALRRKSQRADAPARRRAESQPPRFRSRIRKRSEQGHLSHLSRRSLQQRQKTLQGANRRHLPPARRPASPWRLLLRDFTQVSGRRRRRVHARAGTSAGHPSTHRRTPPRISPHPRRAAGAQAPRQLGGRPTLARSSRLPRRPSRRRLAALQVLHSVQGASAQPRHFAQTLQSYRRPLPRHDSLPAIPNRLLHREAEETQRPRHVRVKKGHAVPIHISMRDEVSVGSSCYSSGQSVLSAERVAASRNVVNDSCHSPARSASFLPAPNPAPTKLLK